jgi:hypothetical protein
MSIAQRAVLKIYFNPRRKKSGGYEETYKREMKWAGIFNFFDIYLFTNGYYPFSYKNHFKNKLLLGFFESEKYFKSIREQLKSEFSVKGFEKNSKLMSMVNEIDSKKSICVGVRRGDFVIDKMKSYCDVCKPIYYENGVKTIKDSDLQKDWKVYVFSDDVEWARENLNLGNDVTYITSSVNGDIKPWEMLQMMTYFKYYVISNSSFFWWGQYLSKAEAPVVVAPDVWRNRDQELYRDIYMENWICISPS